MGEGSKVLGARNRESFVATMKKFRGCVSKLKCKSGGKSNFRNAGYREGNKDERGAHFEM